eukprot:TRINITY_DN1328_c0_g1_i1.p1 TRINITY_DN1328_c0_g1~~TRINITY_DN1328_c0_g1_i1.p1  ORF type:complete len:810 (-),score=172.29 TRINITY_DN1328_c0_g1_i1:88-2517(-)
MGQKRKRGGKGGKGKGKGKGKASIDDVIDGEVSAESDCGEGEPQAKRSGGKCSNGDWKDEPRDYELTNADFEGYYKRQGICPEADWDRMLETLRTGLPAAIRVNGTRAGALALCGRLREMRSICHGDTERDCYAPQQLEWYPHGLAWQWSSLQRRSIKKDSRHKQLKAFLLQRERNGLITRQESVSMIPPLFLDVEPHHMVLDLCAAPGSKTSQLLEMMYQAQCTEGSGPPTGAVIANDLSWNRANMLAHQVRRMGSPCTTVINMDAQFIPDMWGEWPSAAQPVNAEGGPTVLRFDRILADVPCSGDGTMRKQPYIWKKWALRDGLSLHSVQCTILNRGLDLLKVGGRLVYSTCSLNPIEDEAVVASALMRHGDAITLLPRPAALESLRASPGLDNWKVISHNDLNTSYPTFADVPKEMRECKSKLLPSMFPPSPDSCNDGIRASLRAGCYRCLPHLMDTGGFFVAVFEKRSECRMSAKNRRLAFRAAFQAKQSAERASSAASAEPTTQQDSVEASEAREVSTESGDAKRDGAEAGTSAQEPATVPTAPSAVEVAGIDDVAVQESTEVAKLTPPEKLKSLTKEYESVDQAFDGEWQEVMDFYGLAPEMSRRLFVKGPIGRQQVFLVSEGNARLLRSQVQMPTRMVLCGVGAFKQSHTCHVRACSWGLEQEGIAAICGEGLKRRLFLCRLLFRRLVVEHEIPLADIRAAAAAGDVLGLEGLLGCSEGEDALQPGDVAVQLLHEGKEGPKTIVAVCARISDDALELDKIKCEAALLEDLDGPPTVDDILKPGDGEEDEEMEEKEDVADTTA